MNLSREVVTDLLPVYFSGEASEDTRRLVEDYFRQDPDFERIARKAAAPLDTLRATMPIAPDAELEKQDLCSIGWELRSRRAWLVFALFYAALPTISLFTGGRLGLLDAVASSHTWGQRGLLWGISSFFWVLYIIRLPRRNLMLAAAIIVTLCELGMVLNRLNILPIDPPAQVTDLGMIGIGLLAVFFWIWHFRWRAREKMAH